MRLRWLRTKTLTTLTVHLDGGQTIEGVLVEDGRDVLVLRAARWLGDGGTIPLGGEVAIPRERVLFVQTADPVLTLPTESEGSPL